jgi:hypothetical protein
VREISRAMQGQDVLKLSRHGLDYHHESCAALLRRPFLDSNFSGPGSRIARRKNDGSRDATWSQIQGVARCERLAAPRRSQHGKV